MENHEGYRPQEIVGKRICVLRKQLKLTQAALASPLVWKKVLCSD